jgi:type I restriction enzyme, S subunit
MTSIERPLVYKVPKSWNVHTVNEIRSMDAHSCVAGPFGSKISSKFFVDDGVPVIRGSNLRDDLTRFVPENFVFISETKAQEFRPQLVKGGDLIFTCWGTIGQVGLIPENGPYPEYVISNKQLKLRVNQKIASPLFCFYYFASPLHVEHVRNRNIGGAVPGINLGILKSFRIALPPIKVQDRLIEILGSYDNLVENNRRRMALLEDAARQVYQEWFVRLHFPGCEHTRIADGVPEGWNRQTLGEYVTLNYGKALKADTRVDGPFPVYGSSGIVGSHEKALAQGPGIIVGRKGNVGSIFWSTKNFYPIDTVYFINAESSNLYLYYALKDMHFISTDVAVPGLNRNFAYSRQLLLPTDAIIRGFLEVIAPMHEQLEKLDEMNQKLRTARDLLLPRLMSGEISV